jgi:streptogramin lyase
MSARMPDERVDREVRQFLAWQAEEVGNAPSAAEMAARVSARVGDGRMGLRLTPQLAWALLITLLIVALFGAVVVGALLLRQDLFPERGGGLSLGVGGWAKLVVDRDGRIWSAYGGAVSMHDPETGAIQVYSLADEPMLTRAWVLGAARDGGVWLIDDSASGALVRFDGTDVVETLQTLVLEEEVCSLSDGPELLVLACDGDMWRRSEGEWELVASEFPGGYSRDFIVDASGTTWVVGLAEPEEDKPGMWQHRDGKWVVVDHGALLGFAPTGLLAAPDGTVWVHDRHETGRLARWDGESWHRYSAGESGVNFAYDIALSPDGSLWIADLDRGIVRLDGRRFDSFPMPSFGGPQISTPWWQSIAVAPAGLFVSAGGLAHLTEDGFTIVDARYTLETAIEAHNHVAAKSKARAIQEESQKLKSEVQSKARPGQAAAPSSP